MENKIIAQAFWCFLPDTSQITNEIIEKVINGMDSLSLYSSDDIPFLPDFLECVLKPKIENSFKNIAIFDASKEKVIKTILDNYGDSFGYREENDGTSKKCLKTCVGLESTIVVVINIDSTKRYLFSTLMEGLEKTQFIFFSSVSTNYQNLKSINLKEKLKKVDYSILIRLLANKLNYSLTINEYLIELAANLFLDDFNSANIFLGNYKKDVEIEEQLKNKDLVPSNKESIKDIIWESQVKVLYPRIEAYKIGFVKKHGNQITYILPFTVSYGKENIELKEPEDLEIGHIYYNILKHNINCDLRDEQIVNKYHEFRNLLSHQKIISEKDIHGWF